MSWILELCVKSGNMCFGGSGYIYFPLQHPMGYAVINNSPASLGTTFGFLMLATIKLAGPPSCQSDGEGIFPVRGTWSRPQSRWLLHTLGTLVTVPLPELPCMLKLEETLDIISSKLQVTQAPAWRASHSPTATNRSHGAMGPGQQSKPPGAGRPELPFCFPFPNKYSIPTFLRHNYE